MAAFTKYSAAMLLLSMFCLLVFTPQGRESFKKPGFYLAFLLLCLIISPHIIWLFHNEFITVTYGADKMERSVGLANYLYYPAKFALAYLSAFLLPLALFGFLLFGRRDGSMLTTKKQLDSFTKHYLFWLGLGPFLLTLLVSLLTGARLNTAWGETFVSLWGLILVAYVQPLVTRQQWIRFISVLVILMLVAVSIFSYRGLNAGSRSSMNFPGKEIAESVTQQWIDTYGTSLAYVAGSRWTAASVAHYSQQQPAVYMDWNDKRNPWLDKDDMLNTGAVFIWSPSRNESLSEEVKQRFPELVFLPAQYYHWVGNDSSEPVEIRLAFLPPKLWDPPSLQAS